MNEDIPTQEQQVRFKVHSKARDGKEAKQAQKQRWHYIEAVIAQYKDSEATA